MDLGISGRRAIVCGGSKGLGRSCAEALAREGVQVWIAARSPESLEQAAREIAALSGAKIEAVVADVVTPEGRRAIVEACPNADILVNNAGGPPPGNFRNWSREDWIRALDANMLSAIELIRLTIDGMIAREFGRVVNITSHMVKSPVGLLGLSNGARAGLTGFTSGLSREVAAHGVTLNNLLPGQFDTDRLRSNHEKFAGSQKRPLDDFRDSMRKQIPAQRFGRPAESGAACAFLCSAQAGFITGQSLLLDGGQFPRIHVSEAQLPDEVAREIAAPASYAEWEGLHRTLAQVRRTLPFARAELPEYLPFWVASKLGDIREVASRNQEFLSGMGGMMTRDQLAFESKKGAGQLFRSIVAMNEPDHRKYRGITQSWFQQSNLRRFEPRIRALAARHADRLVEVGGECDFVREVAVHYPLLVVMAILGVPEADEPFILRLTREYFGNADDELGRGGVAKTPVEAVASVREVIEEATAYFAHLSAERRRAPTGDLMSVIANSRIDDTPISDVDAMGYYITVAFAGHDTTSSSVAGGMWALAERPDQLARVRADASLVPALVEESVRWTTPIHQFVRYAASDAEVAGQRVRKGDLIMLCFPSGNRDEDVFDAPFEFRADRTPNRQIGFGFGAHMCLGVHLARMEMAILFEELLPRIESLELAGIPRRTVTNFVGGPKSLPIRARMRA